MKEKVKKPFYKKWWFIAIVILVILGAWGSSMTGDSDNNSDPQATTVASNDGSKSEPTTAATTEEKSDTYSDGMYKVGTDIQPGLYRVKLSGIMPMAYVERAKDSTMELDSIIANLILTGDGYVQIKDTDGYVKVTGGVLSPFDISTATSNYSAEYEDGMYLVGIDIEPGEYKVEVTDTVTKMGYTERLSDATYDLSSIIANNVVQNQSYLTIKDGDFAVRLQSVKLSK